MDGSVGEIRDTSGQVEGPLLDIIVANVVGDIDYSNIWRDLEYDAFNLCDVGIFEEVGQMSLL